MKVTLLQSYPDEMVACHAAAICVDSKKVGLHNLKAAVGSGHISVLEHLPLTFLIEDISRACSHQLVRHRNSFSQQSQRYTKLDSNASFVIPKGTFNSDIQTYVDSLLNEVQDVYKLLIDSGYPAEDARKILPNCTPTKLIVTMNARSLVTSCYERLCNKAELEIRRVHQLMREEIKTVYPTVHNLCVPKCVAYGTCREKRPCKRNK